MNWYRAVKATIFSEYASFQEVPEGTNEPMRYSAPRDENPCSTMANGFHLLERQGYQVAKVVKHPRTAWPKALEKVTDPDNGSLWGAEMLVDDRLPLDVLWLIPDVGEVLMANAMFVIIEVEWSHLGFGRTWE